MNARITFPFEDRYPNKYTPTLAGVKADDHLYRFIDDPLYAIQYFFPRSGFNKVQEAMVATYGKRKITTKDYQNAYTWRTDTSFIALDASSLTYIHYELIHLADARKAQFHKPRL